MSRTACTAYLLVALLQGCLATRAGQLPADEILPDRSRSSGKSIALSIRVERTVNGEDRELPDHVREEWIQATLAAYRDSGLFSEVRRGTSRKTDLQATVEVSDDVAGSQAFSYVSAMSWLLLPSRSRETLLVRTIYRDRDGGVLATYRAEETVTTWYQLLLLPALPFAAHDGVVAGTIGDLSRATTRRAQDKGIL